MVGTWRLGELKVRSGTYFRRTATGVTVEGATNGILACVFQSNFGALNRVVDLSPADLNNLEDIFGTGATFLREGFLGGATTIRAVRVGSGGTASTITLKGTGSLLYTIRENPTANLAIADVAIGRDGNGLLGDDSNDTPAEINLVKLENKYAGSRAFSIMIRDNLATGGRQLVVLDGTDIFTVVNFAKGGDEAQALVDALANNRYFTATKLASGTLADVTQAKMTAGTDPAVTKASYAAATDLLERYRWNCIVADTDDAEVQSVLIDFVKLSYELGHLGFACIAGRSSQSLDARLSFANAINDEKVVYVLNGWNDIYGTAYDGYLAAARIGGMIAAVETNNSLTHITISNALELIDNFTNGEIIEAEQKGCLVLSLNDNEQVQIDKAINTLVTVGNDMDAGWSKIRRVKTRFELMTRINQTCERLVGRLNNDSNGRSTIVAAMQGVIDEMVAEKKLFFGSNAKLDPDHKPEGDRAYFLIQVGDIDSLEQFYLTYQFSFANPFEEV